MPNTHEITPAPGKEAFPQREKLLNEPFTGAQALMLLGIQPPEKGKPVSKLKETSIIEFANNGIPSEHKEKIRKASFNERDEFWKGMSFDEAMDIWRKKMNTFLDPIKTDSTKIKD